MANGYMKSILHLWLLCNAKEDNEISSSSRNNRFHQGLKKQHMTMRLHGKRSPSTLLLGMCATAITLEFSVKIPQKAKNRDSI